MTPVSVFVVEDSVAFQTALSDLLQTLGGFVLLGAVDGESRATDWLHHHRQDWGLAIIDLLLAEGSGFGLVHRFRREHPAGRIVVFSEFATPVMAQKCLKLGADAVFRKSDMPQFVRYLEDLPAGPGR